MNLTHTHFMAGGRTAPSADKVHYRANRAGPVAGWTWRDARRTLHFGKKEGATSIGLYRNGEARFHFPTLQLSASSAEGAVGQQSGAPTQQQKQRANRVQPMQQPTTDTPMESESLSNSQHKSAARLQKFNLEMAAILKLKLRNFVLRALKRVRYERVWSVARPWIKQHAARASGTVISSSLICTGEGKGDVDQDSAGAKRTSRPISAKVNSPSASSPPSKTRSRTGASTTLTSVDSPSYLTVGAECAARSRASAAARSRSPAFKIYPPRSPAQDSLMLGQPLGSTRAPLIRGNLSWNS